jgi:DNA topoisomerase
VHRFEHSEAQKKIISAYSWPTRMLQCKCAVQMRATFAAAGCKLRASGRAVLVPGYLAAWADAYTIRQRYAAEAGHDDGGDDDAVGARARRMHLPPRIRAPMALLGGRTQQRLQTTTFDKVLAHAAGDSCVTRADDGEDGTDEAAAANDPATFACHAVRQLTKGQMVSIASVESVQHETAPPPYFTEGALVKKLEELGIGRPSTYAGIIETLQDRCASHAILPDLSVSCGLSSTKDSCLLLRLQVEGNHDLWQSDGYMHGGVACRDYVTKQGGSLVPTGKGRLLSAFLEEYFPEWVNDGFSSLMEDRLDEISAGSLDSRTTLDTFWSQLTGDVAAMKDVAVSEVCS